MRTPTSEEIALFKRLAQDGTTDDSYYEIMIPIVLEHVNDNVQSPFEDDYNNLPGTVKLFVAQTISYFASAVLGLESERFGSVSYDYNFNELPKSICGLLQPYGYGLKKIQHIRLWG